MVRRNASWENYVDPVSNEIVNSYINRDAAQKKYAFQNMQDPRLSSSRKRKRKTQQVRRGRHKREKDRKCWLKDGFETL